MPARMAASSGVAGASDDGFDGDSSFYLCAKVFSDSFHALARVGGEVAVRLPLPWENGKQLLKITWYVVTLYPSIFFKSTSVPCTVHDICFREYGRIEPRLRH